MGGSIWTSGGPLADFWRICREYFSCGLKQTWCGFRKSPPRTHKPLADSPRMCHKYAVEQWTFWFRKKTEKDCQSAKRVQISSLWTFFRFWWTILVDKSPIVRRWFAADLLSAQKVHPEIPPIMVRSKSLPKKSISKICRPTSAGRCQCGHSSANVVRWGRVKG